MKNSKFVLGKITKLLEQGLVSSRDLTNELITILKSKRDEIVFKMKLTSKDEFEILSKRVRNALNAVYIKKVARTKNLVGCEISFLKQYIANKFKKGMSWDNYGEWEIDHIRPCSSYNLKDPEQQLECFNYSNLQPLWKKENRKKSDKY